MDDRATGRKALPSRESSEEKEKFEIIGKLLLMYFREWIALPSSLLEYELQKAERLRPSNWGEGQ